MSSPVFALALDAVPPVLLETWIAQDAMPRVAALIAGGAYGHLDKAEDHPHEVSWSTLLHGCDSYASGEWGQQLYYADRYQVEVRIAHNLDRPPPFYSLVRNEPLVIFDVPQAHVINSLQGTQVLGWGLEENLFTCASQPADLLAEIVQSHGVHPFFSGGAARVIDRGQDGEATGFRLPSVYDQDALRTLDAQIVSAIARRADILIDLMERSPWKFVFAGAPELHLAMHMLWHEPSRLIAIARAFDASLERMLRAVPADTRLALFSVSGMTANYSDLPTTMFLPEFLYRLQFGEAALAEGTIGTPVPAPANHYRKHWKDEVWALRTKRGARDLESPEEQGRRNDPMDWSPLNWYSPLWPRMRAFALPSFSHGMVRINLRGRDLHGIVDPADYARCCDELTEAVQSLRNARSGRPIAKIVTRTRSSPDEDGEHLPPADLMITWNSEESTDTVESSIAGRIGPIPWMRTGGHTPNGFCVLNGGGVVPGSRIRDAAGITDLTATLIQMLKITPPTYLAGHSLI